MAHIRGLLVVSLVLAAGSPLRGDIDSTLVKVEFMDGQTKVTPGDPTINLAASPSIVLEVQPGDATFDVTPVLATNALVQVAQDQLTELKSLDNTKINDAFSAYITNPSKENFDKVKKVLGNAKRDPGANQADKDKIDNAKAQLEKKEEGTTQSANRFLLNFHRGWWWEYGGGSRSDIWKAHCIKDSKGNCDHHVDFIEPLPGAGWDIYLTNRTYASDFPIVITCRGDKCKKGGSASRLLVIHLDTASWAIASSAGVIFPYLRDERYSVNSDNQLVRLPDGGIPYFAATYLHYCQINGVPVLEAFCPTLVVGTQVPSDGILIGLGLGARIKPLKSINAAYFDFGVAYGPHKTLNDTYLGMPPPRTVPAGTNPDDVLKTRYAFKFFVGVSIGITDGIEKFRGVFPGTKGESSKVEQAPSANENDSDSEEEKPNDEGKGKDKGKGTDEGEDKNSGT